MSLPALINIQSASIASPLFLTPIGIDKVSLPKTLKFTKRIRALSPSFQSSHSSTSDIVFEPNHVVGDCVVFEDGIFEDPYLSEDEEQESYSNFDKLSSKKQKQKKPQVIEPQNLVPDKWREVQAEINITKDQRRRIKHEMEYSSKLDKRKPIPVKNANMEEFKTFREAKLAQLKPLVRDKPSSFPVKEETKGVEEVNKDLSERVAPKNPRWAVYGKGLNDVTEFFNGENYQPGDKKSEGPRKLFTKEEKFLLSRRKPNLAPATSTKWQPLHTLAASGEFYLVDALLKHNVDINSVDKDGLTALHRAIIGKKQALTNYLLRESANPFIQDESGATLMHYAVQTASIPAIKLLLLYNVNINLQDNNGWTPLHLAVQARRTDVVRILLIKGADKTSKNKDGLTPLDLCLYCGQEAKTYELIKLLKRPPKRS